MFGVIGLKHNRDEDLITVYFINRKSISTGDINPNGMFKMSGGISPTGTGVAYKTLEENNRIDAGNIMHEIMHAIALPHTFPEVDKEGNSLNSNKTHMFEKDSTKNYMDYKINKQYTWKWQWEKLREYSKLR